MELDIYVPSHQIAFEYQGGHHYNQKISSNIQQQKQRGDQKKIVCNRLGITLIEIPYCWPCSMNTLASTINKIRPDVRLKYNTDLKHPEHSVSHSVAPSATSLHRKYFDWIAVQL